jgi:hypothetical protein
VAGSCEYGDEPTGSGATELVNLFNLIFLLPFSDPSYLKPAIPFGRFFFAPQ